MQGYRYTHGDRPLDGYTIHYALGRGGFGEVYFAHSDSGREVALKAVQNFEEIELRGIGHCMNLKSPHLVTIFDVKQDTDGRPWVIMEYVSGPALNAILDEAVDGSGRKIGIGHDQAMYFTRELIKGLRYLHDAGVVHRDLKPHNIFFEDGAVKIGDYSLSKVINTSQHSSHTTTVGSVHYMAPEIGEGNYGKAVDIYALGVILYEMLTGTPPYVGESMGEVLIKHLTAEPDVSKIDSRFAPVILKAMARKPEARFATVDEMLMALCPEDHSSYQSPPASLSMIGDSAKRARSKQNRGEQPVIAKPPRAANAGAEIVETTTAYESLVETHDVTDSQPFQRPGIGIPRGGRKILNVLGLWWKRSPDPVKGSDPVGLAMRALMAIVASTVFVLMGVVLSPMPSWLGLGALLITAPLLGGFYCWAFLQVLPRGDSFAWSCVSSVAAAAIVTPSVCFYVAVLEEFRIFRFDPDHIVAFLIFSLIVDWRCFISADRYPRVGLLRTLVAVGALMVTVLICDGREQEAVCAGVLGAAIIVTIQILAPHVRVIKKQTGNLKSHDSLIEQRPGEDVSLEDLGETGTDTDAFLLQEKT